ncbi:hypothetical protein AND_010410 [Anopheles darlingi]|uniref:Uncharacterized protein n=1 Tax=Anopheles darlingi TaxID=43151 RepID=W5J3W7_ANODA|nr:hypothetical protein AND_010410 [Anopheles darlingi]
MALTDSLARWHSNPAAHRTPNCTQRSRRTTSLPSSLLEGSIATSFGRAIPRELLCWLCVAVADMELRELHVAFCAGMLNGASRDAATMSTIHCVSSATPP